jgi:hypothetical protein
MGEPHLRAIDPSKSACEHFCDDPVVGPQETRVPFGAILANDGQRAL